MGHRVFHTDRYDRDKPENNRQVTTFAENAERLRRLKAAGFDRLNVSLSGWLNHGTTASIRIACRPTRKAAAGRG